MAPPLRLPPARCLLLGAAFAGAFAAAFGPTLRGGLFMEDHFFLREIHRAGGWGRFLSDLHGNWLGFQGYPYFRPWVTASLALDHAVFGLAPWGYHLTNLLLHGANGFLFFVLARRLLKGGGLAAAAAVAFFLFHPVQVNAVGWVAARSDLLSGLGILGAAAAYGRFWARPAELSARRLGLVAFLLALGAKESGVVALPLAFLHPGPTAWRARARVLLPAFVALCAYGLWRATVIRGGELLPAVWPPSLHGAVRLGGQIPLALDPGTAWRDGGGSGLALASRILGALLLVSLVVALARTRSLHFTAAYALALLICGLLPVLPIAATLSGEHFFGYGRFWYVAIAGPALLAGAAGAPGRGGRLGRGAALALAACFVAADRVRFHRDLGEPARMAREAACLLVGEPEPPRAQWYRFFLRAAGDRYGGVHFLPLAVTAAAQPPFVARCVPVFTTDLSGLLAFLREHGGHEPVLVVGFASGKTAPEVLLRLGRVPRWRFRRVGPFRLPPGVPLELPARGQSPFAFDRVRLEGVSGEGRLALQVETDRGVFSRETLVLGAGLTVRVSLRAEPGFLKARRLRRLRLVALGEPVGEEYLGLEAVAAEDRPVGPAPLRRTPRGGLVWLPEALGAVVVRYYTAFGPFPPLPQPPLRPAEGIPDELARQLLVNRHLGGGKCLLLVTPAGASDRRFPPVICRRPPTVPTP